MKPYLLKVSQGPSQSFSVRRDVVPHVNNLWHYHKETELIHFKAGEGTQFVGDNIKRFKSGDVVLVGSNLPHYWRFDDSYFEAESLKKTDTSVCHFTEDFWGSQFLYLPENQVLKLVLDRAKMGLQITGITAQTIAGILEKLLQAKGPERIILLIEALAAIGASSEVSELSSIGFSQNLLDTETDRINAIYDYSIKNAVRKIPLEEIAGVANISPHSFCRYFKSRTRKTYSQFLIEIRVGMACRLLLENKLSMKQVCFESGFNNFTSFHKYFKKIMAKSPLVYQKEYMQL